MPFIVIIGDSVVKVLMIKLSSFESIYLSIILESGNKKTFFSFSLIY
jgi:hypothetical protein